MKRHTSMTLFKILNYASSILLCSTHLLWLQRPMWVNRVRIACRILCKKKMERERESSMWGLSKKKMEHTALRVEQKGVRWEEKFARFGLAHAPIRLDFITVAPIPLLHHITQKWALIRPWCFKLSLMMKMTLLIGRLHNYFTKVP